MVESRPGKLASDDVAYEKLKDVDELVPFSSVVQISLEKSKRGPTPIPPSVTDIHTLTPNPTQLPTLAIVLMINSVDNETRRWFSREETLTLAVTSWFEYSDELPPTTSGGCYNSKTNLRADRAVPSMGDTQAPESRASC
jgi:hypothetical protein